MHRFECRLDVDYQLPCTYFPAEALLCTRRSLPTVSLRVQAPTPKKDVYLPESGEKQLFIWGALGGANLTFYPVFWFITFIYNEECVIPRSRTIILTHRDHKDHDLLVSTHLYSNAKAKCGHTHVGCVGMVILSPPGLYREAASLLISHLPGCGNSMHLSRARNFASHG